MGCRGMRGHIGTPGNGIETWWQMIKRKIWNRFWPHSEYLLDSFLWLFQKIGRKKSLPVIHSEDENFVYDKDGKAIGVKGNRGPS